MKSLVQWGTRLSLMTTLLLSPVVGINLMPLPAVAIPETDLVEKLSRVPVYVISVVNNEKKVLLTVPAVRHQGQPNEQKVFFTEVFIDEKDAKASLQGFQQENPDFPYQLETNAIPLSEVYRLYQTHKGDQEPLIFKFTPKATDLEQARSILRQQGDPAPEKFGGVPIFMATAGEDGGYLKVEVEVENQNYEAVLAFFDYQDLQDALAEYKKQSNSANNEVSIRITSLERLMDFLITEDDPVLRILEFVPTPEGRMLIEQERQRQESGQGQPQPSGR